ncbi:MAG: hypothetical protein PHZ04_03590 [Patescibacteria group bacterium]|nr:hypothetical protein [Patescibacteria group bacterium]MDD5294531.1 hypothetical protein [Patescibacteria group bacterium]MDD5554237.1 hypothetical protein [Patescibacteria group bacterium]
MKKLIIVLVILVALGGAGYKIFGGKTAGSILSPEEAKAKAGEFINANLVQAGTEVEIKDIVEENGLYKIVVNVGGQDFDSYLTKDGTKFFPQVLDMTADAAATDTSDTAAGGSGSEVAAKSDKPNVELFVMSHCPYGTQIEKGILPVIEALGSKIDFTLKFCDYAMHGENELKEELKQYCIQKEQGDKLNGYLKCFLEAGDGDGCIAKAGLDKSKLDACVSATDKEYKVTEKFNDKTTWSNGQFPVFDVYKADNDKYGVSGSPTLVINGAQVTSNRDSASLLATICSAFNTAPEECSQSLSSTAPSAGFGSTAGAAASDATCN